MASSAIHLAVAKKYYERNNISDYDNFIAGSLYPDAADDKDQAHYTDSNRGTNNVSYLQSKVNLYSFLKGRKELNDFELGWFLHLVTDYLFYNKYLDKIEKPQIYYDYDYTNEDIVNKYSLELPEEVYKDVSFKKGTPKILTLELAYKIIEEVSNLDILEIEKNVNNIEWNTYKKIV